MPGSGKLEESLLIKVKLLLCFLKGGFFNAKAKPVNNKAQINTAEMVNLIIVRPPFFICSNHYIRNDNQFFL